MLRSVLFAFGAAALAGCAPTVPIMARIDGKTASDSPASVAQMRQDKSVCNGEVSKAILTAPGVYPTQLMTNVYTGCMAGRGYRPTDQSEPMLSN
ncbi:hypothetical protein [Bosea caraganae]|nr:hypothetical protein [Bosea caraganae]